LMDSPQRTQRWHGMDRWTYIFYADQMREEKEVHFLNGTANYVGDIYKPEISAEEQDRRNEVANVEIENTLKSRREQIQHSISNELQPPPSIRSFVPQFDPVQ
jgi:outer membrane protein assembly factor BamE